MFSFIKSLLDKLLLEVVESNFWSDKLRIHLVKWLLACGANPNVQDSDGYRLIYYAIVQSNTEIAKLLIDKGAFNDDYRVISGNCTLTLLHIAVMTSSPDMVKLLLDTYKKRQPNEWSSTLNNFLLGDMINVVDENYQTPLHLAVARNRSGIVKLFLKYEGIILDIKNSDGRTALNIAESNNNQEIKNMIQAGCTPDMTANGLNMVSRLYNQVAMHKIKTVGRNKGFAAYFSYSCSVASGFLDKNIDEIAYDESINKYLRAFMVITLYCISNELNHLGNRLSLLEDCVLLSYLDGSLYYLREVPKFIIYGPKSTMDTVTEPENINRNLLAINNID